MKNQNIIARFLGNAYIKNILMMLVVAVALVAVVLVAINYYTRHNESVKLPSVKGLQVEEAESILQSSGLQSKISKTVYEGEGAPGSVIEQIPAGESNVKKGRTVFLIVKARDVQMVAMPELTDFSLRQAEAKLNSLGFNKISIEEVPGAYKGLVIAVSYRGKDVAPGEKIPKGSPLRLTVGTGIEELGADSIFSDNSQDVEQSFFE